MGGAAHQGFSEGSDQAAGACLCNRFWREGYAEMQQVQQSEAATF
jgi:hypothetical protein